MAREGSRAPVLAINLITDVNTGIIGDGLRLSACVHGAGGGALGPSGPFPLAQLSAPVSCRDGHQFGLSSLNGGEPVETVEPEELGGNDFFSHLL